MPVGPWGPVPPRGSIPAQIREKIRVVRAEEKRQQKEGPGRRLWRDGSGGNVVTEAGNWGRQKNQSGAAQAQRLQPPSASGSAPGQVCVRGGTG